MKIPYDDKELQLKNLTEANIVIAAGLPLTWTRGQKTEFASTMSGINVVADIGNSTMNVLYMINGKPQSGKMYTEVFGTYQCTLAVREQFMQKTSRTIHDVIIEEVLRTGTAAIAPVDIKIIRAITTEYVKDIFRRLREYGYDEGTMTLYVTGGGGRLVKNFYKFNADRVKFVEDICAATKGYEYLAKIHMTAGN